MAKPTQTPWHVLNITGHAIDASTGKVDDTEGNGAFDSIIQVFKPHCPKNFDNGGGAFDDASKYVQVKYGIENAVYDPYMRKKDHNDAVLEKAQVGAFDCCTSISVLNVIDCPYARHAHITLCHQSLKANGTAFFKIWPGDKSGKGVTTTERYQSNCDASYYVKEIQTVFGSINVELVDSKTIKATKTF